MGCPKYLSTPYYLANEKSYGLQITVGKLRIFPTPLLFGVPLPMFPFKFRGEVNRE